MRIAYIHDVIYPYTKGGAEKRVWEISKRLARRGHEVHIFGMKYWDGEEVIEEEGVHLHGVCEPRKLYVDGKRSIGAAVYFSWRVLLSFRGDFDIIDAQEFPYLPCFSAKIHSWLRRTPLVITWHEVWDGYWYEYMGRKGIFGRSVERWATRLRNMPRIIWIIYMTSCVKHLPQHEVVSKAGICYRYERGYKL